jgi:hypothetical protein
VTDSANDRVDRKIQECVGDRDAITLGVSVSIIAAHKRKPVEWARCALIGALRWQAVSAWTRCSWYWVHGVGLTDKGSGQIPNDHWSVHHRNHWDRSTGQIPSADALDWNLSEVRLWRQSNASRLPDRTMSLIEGRGSGEMFEWEYTAQRVTISRHDLIRIACDGQLANYGRRLLESPRERPGRPTGEVWKQTNAKLVADAYLNIDAFKEATESPSKMSNYIRDVFSTCSADGLNEPSDREVNKVAKAVLEAIERAVNDLRP